MLSDYKLFDPKEEEKEKEKNKKKKDHSTGYYKFVNQFKYHLKKIENDYTGEEITQLPNHFNLINKYENEFEEQKENCLNCYNALKEQISLIEKVIPNFDINIFNTFFQNFEEYYSFFQKSQEILQTFSQYNDDTQNLFYILKRKNFCIEALKDFVDKISEEYAEKVEKYDILSEKFKNLMESYDKLYKIYQESKSSDLKQYENIDNKELMIKKLNDKIHDSTIENDRIKKKYFECSHDLELLNLAVKVKYVLKTESEKIINELKFRMNKMESDNINFKQEIKNLKIENEKLAQENEYLEEQINNQLNNIRISKSNKDDSNTLENLIEENVEKENEEKEIEPSEETDNDLNTGNDLDDLLKDCEEIETEEEQGIDNGKPKESIDESNKNEPKLITKDKLSNILEVKNNNDNSNIIVNENINKANKNNTEKYKKSVSFDIINNLHNSLAKSKSKNIRLRGAKKNNLRQSGSVKIRLNQKSSNNINSAYNIMFQGKQFQFPSRVVSKKNFDYFKQFFFLLFQSMKMNSDKIGPFLGYDPETLYAQCRNEHIPFHKYQHWLEKKMLRREQIENEKKYEDFETITGIFCSSLI